MSRRSNVGSVLILVSQWISVAKNGIWVIGVCLVPLIASIVNIIKWSESTRLIIASVSSCLVGLIVGGYWFRHVSYARDTSLGYRVHGVKTVL